MQIAHFLFRHSKTQMMTEIILSLLIDRSGRSICSQDIEQKPNSNVMQGLNSLTNLRKMMCNNPNGICRSCQYLKMSIQNLVKLYPLVLKILSLN